MCVFLAGGARGGVEGGRLVDGKDLLQIDGVMNKRVPDNGASPSSIQLFGNLCETISNVESEKS